MESDFATLNEFHEGCVSVNVLETQRGQYIQYNDGKVCWYYPIFPEVNQFAAVSSANPIQFPTANIFDPHYYNHPVFPYAEEQGIFNHAYPDHH